MRGKKTIRITMATIFIACLAISMMGVPKAHAFNEISVVNPLDGSSEFGPFSPGDSFYVDITVDFAILVRAFEFKLSWDPTILRLDPLEPAVEGPFLPSTGQATFFVKSTGVAGESVTVTDLIQTYNTADAYWPTVLATVKLTVIGGGQTNLVLEAELYDRDFIPWGAVPHDGYFWSTFPHVSFTWFVPTAVNPDPSFMNVTGISYYTTQDAIGDIDFHDGPEYWVYRPVLELDDATGLPESIVDVEGATMFFGDIIRFDASQSYDLDNNGDPTPVTDLTFKYTIRAGGVDTFKGNDVKYESGNELPTGSTFDYIFPGKLPYVYSVYNSMHLGWFDLLLEVTDKDAHKAEYYTWIRIYRVMPARTVNININDRQHSLSKDGNTMTLGGKVKNLGGTNYFPWDALTVYLELARVVHTFVMARMEFTITDMAGNKVGKAYSDAIWMAATETHNSLLSATWTIPNTVPPGTYTVTAKAWFGANGVGYGIAASGAASTTIQILP